MPSTFTLRHLVLTTVLLVLTLPFASAFNRHHDRKDHPEEDARQNRHHHQWRHHRQSMQTQQQLLVAQQFAGSPKMASFETPSFPVCTTIVNCYANCEAIPGFNSFVVNKCEEQVTVQVITSNYSSSYWATIPGARAGNFSNLHYFNTESSMDYRLLGPELRSALPQTCLLVSGNQVINYCPETVEAQYFYTCNAYCDEVVSAAVMKWVTVPGFDVGSRANIVHIPRDSSFCDFDNSMCYGNAMLVLGGHVAK